MCFLACNLAFGYVVLWDHLLALVHGVSVVVLFLCILVVCVCDICVFLPLCVCVCVFVCVCACVSVFQCCGWLFLAVCHLQIMDLLCQTFPAITRTHTLHGV